MGVALSGISTTRTGTAWAKWEVGAHPRSQRCGTSQVQGVLGFHIHVCSCSKLDVPKN